MSKEILTRSNNISREYCCSIVRVGEVVPIEGSDFLGKTIVDGFQIVVRKDMVKEGDIMFYASNESELNEKFLSVNNQFEDYKLNSNYESEVLPRLKAIEDCKAWINSYDTSVSDPVKDAQLAEKKEQIRVLEEELKTLRGFFNKYGRVKMITLRKCPSLGYLFTIDSMQKYCPKIKDVDLASIVDDPNADKDFDTVNGELFVKAYMPRVKVNPSATESKGRKRQKKVEKFDRIVENQFVFHYDTQMLNKNMQRITPNDEVYISVKMHGTSVIIGNLKVRELKKYTGLFGNLRTFVNKKILPKRFKKYDVTYDNIYSSRNVIKNQYINEKVSDGFYGTDIWGEYQKKLQGYIPKGMTIYGEIVGYLTGSESMIQKNYDYGCNIGENRLMIYRITTEEEDGSKREWEIDEIIAWVNELTKEDTQHWKDILIPFPLLYKGTLRALYPDIPTDSNWGEAVLERLKTEPIFLMEQNEPRCRNKVPREGIVLRIANDPLKEAFKLKCNKFLAMEGKMIDEGVIDMESTMRYDSEETP